jgi:hypothetical protein
VHDVEHNLFLESGVMAAVNDSVLLVLNVLDRGEVAVVVVLLLGRRCPCVSPLRTLLVVLFCPSLPCLAGGLVVGCLLGDELLEEGLVAGEGLVLVHPEYTVFGMGLAAINVLHCVCLHVVLYSEGLGEFE